MQLPALLLPNTLRHLAPLPNGCPLNLFRKRLLAVDATVEGGRTSRSGGQVIFQGSVLDGAVRCNTWDPDRVLLQLVLGVDVLAFAAETADATPITPVIDSDESCVRLLLRSLAEDGQAATWCYCISTTKIRVVVHILLIEWHATGLPTEMRQEIQLF